MSKYSWQIKLGIVLLASSFLIYSLKFFVLGDPENTYYYVFNALGFLPINVLLVTLVLNELLSVRARRERLEKLNMVIGTFFSEVGTDLLKNIACTDPKISTLEETLRVRGDWTDEDFQRVRETMEGYTYQVDFSRIDIGMMRLFLKEKRNFLLRLLENPMLLENQAFTELLRAVFHFTEEVERRDAPSCLTEKDCLHLKGDVERIYRLLSLEWLSYMKHLHAHYPYLSSLAMRTNPFDSNASVVIS
ncbi:MAG TPA: hypothetical protein PK069_09380 [Methanolinea sp.]|nr:hypothetical protein [Methanolinea sp.]HQK56725.1 hypothetical protein [Methanolinea sp.]